MSRLQEAPGVFSQGKTLADLEDNIRDAYELALEVRPSCSRKVQRA